VWDADGAAYLDTPRVSSWRRQQSVDVRQPRDEQEQLLSRLVRSVLQQLAGCTAASGDSEGLVQSLRPVQVVLAGGFAAVSGCRSCWQSSCRLRLAVCSDFWCSERPAP
jgi:hypothetical protein